MWEHLCLCNQPNLHFLQFVRGCVFGVLKTFLCECFTNVFRSLLQIGSFYLFLRNGLPYQHSIIFNCTYLIKFLGVCSVFQPAKAHLLLVKIFLMSFKTFWMFLPHLWLYGKKLLKRWFWSATSCKAPVHWSKYTTGVRTPP